MTHDDDVDPSRQPDLSEPAWSLTPEQMEAVVGRAVELQAGGAGPGGEGVSEAEMVRIGQELGLDPATVRRAMVEVRSRPDEGKGLLRAMGARFARTLRSGTGAGKSEGVGVPTAAEPRAGVDADPCGS